MRNLLFKAFFAMFFLSCAGILSAQDNSYGVFVPVSKYIEEGNAQKLSAWFADNLEISVLTGSGSCSRKQARQIMKSFFDKHRPSSFIIEHRASRANMKYALGLLVAGGDKFYVTIFVGMKDGDYRIQQLKIEDYQ